jgi:hypothetical protein
MVFKINLIILISKIVVNYVQFAKIKVIAIDFNFKYWEKYKKELMLKFVVICERF